MMNIDGKVVIVTGAAAGIGRATAVEFAKQRARGILLADVDADGLRETEAAVVAAGSTAVQAAVDVRSVDALEGMYATALDRFGGIDVVFNNAGIVTGPPPFPDSPFERVRALIEIDLTAVVISTQLAIGHMRSRGGAIVNTASTAGLTPYLADAPYAAAKAAVIMFSRCCESLRETMNLRVNAICPGVTETAILEKTGGGRRPDWLAPLLEAIEILRPEDIAAEVVRIVKDDTMAGQFVVVENRPRGR